MDKLLENTDLINKLKGTILKSDVACGEFTEVKPNSQSEFYQMVSEKFTQMYLIATEELTDLSFLRFGFYLGCVQEAFASMGGVDAWWKIYDHSIQKNNWELVAETLLQHGEMLELDCTELPELFEVLACAELSELPRSVIDEFLKGIKTGLFIGPVTSVKVTNPTMFKNQTEHCLHQIIRFCHGASTNDLTSERKVQIGLQLGRLQYLMPIISDNLDWYTVTANNISWLTMFHNQTNWLEAKETFIKINEQLGFEKPSDEFINRP